MGRLVDDELWPDGGEPEGVAREGAMRVLVDGLELLAWVVETVLLLLWFLLRLKPKDLNRELIRSM